MFENEDFIAWANENCVTAVGHDGATPGNEDHKPLKVVDPKTKEEKEICPSYAGLTCAEHKAVRHAAESPPEGWDKMPESKGIPNNAMFGPDGHVEKIDNVKALTAKSLMETLAEFQKKYDKPIPFKKWDAYNKSLADGDKAVEDGKWKVALAAYLKVDNEGKKLSKGLIEKIKTKLDAVNAKVVEAFGKIKDGDGEAPSKLKAMQALKGEVGQKFSTGNLAVLADITTWLKENAAPPK